MRPLFPLLLLALIQPVVAGEFDCVTEPSQVVEIRAAVEGLIDRIYVDRGHMVRAGQTVATLDAGLEKSNAELARFKSTMKGALQSGENRLEYAGLKATRSEQLHKERFVSAQDKDEAITEKRLAEAQLLEVRDNQRLAEIEYHRANEQLRLRTLTTPISGVVTDRFMNPGELADNRDLRRPIMKIANINVLHVETLLPLEAHRKVKPGQTATVIPEAPIGGQYQARVKVVDKVVDAASGTFGVRLELSNPKLDIPAGVKCKVVFPEVNVERPLGRRSAEPSRIPAPSVQKSPRIQ
jgi:RND family efflux transporter MFP subunit